ncbi:MAG: metallophosphatase, partial [Pseudomonadota bacterium]
IITLGDNFHDDHASSRLSEDAVSLIWAIAEKRELIWITGNHDPSPPDNVPGSCVEEIAIGGITLRHIADPSCAVPEMSGHLHPAAKIRVRGKSVRKPCFITDGTRMIIPSFGVYTGGLNVCDQAFHGLFKTQSMCAYMLGTDRVFPIHGHQLVV